MDCLVYAEKMDEMEYRKTRKTKRIYKKARNRCHPSMGRLLQEQVEYLEEDSSTEVSTACCVASYKDWCVILDSEHCFLWNSTSRQKVQLPTITTKLKSRSFKCIFTAPPTKVHSAVFFFFQHEPVFLYCKVGSSSCWTEYTYSRDPECVRSEAIFCNGKIFATRKNTKLLFEFDPWSTTCRQNRITSDDQDIDMDPIMQNLVDAGGELFLVQRFSISRLEIYKFDFSCGRWVQVHDLGNLVFVLSSLHSASFDAEELGVQGNCVYFTGDDFECLYLFNLGDETLSIMLNRPDSGSIWLSLEGQIPVLRLTAEQHNEEELNGYNNVGGGHAKEDEITEEDNSIFSLLPSDVLGDIAKCLVGGVNYMNFRLACRRWSLIAPPCRWSHVDSTTTMPYPWLMFFSDQVHDTFKFYDPRDEVTYHMKTAEVPPDCVIRDTMDGWLLATHGENSVFLFELFTKRKIQLPDLNNYTVGCDIAGMWLSVPPISSNYMVFGIRRTRPGQCYFFHYHPNIGRWAFSRIIEFTPALCNLVLYQELVSCLGEDGRFGAYKIQESDGRPNLVVYNQDQKLVFPTPVSRSFLVTTSSCKDFPVLAVFVGILGRWVHVYSFNPNKFEWVKLDHLGNLALFVSETRSLVIETDDEEEATAAMKNRIYFPVFSNNKLIYYSMDSRTFHTSEDDEKLHADFVYTKEQLNCTWFLSSLVPRPCS